MTMLHEIASSKLDLISPGPPILAGFCLLHAVHENRYVKRAGVAGVRARAKGAG